MLTIKNLYSRFKWKHALTSHMITHSKNKKFLCQDCGFATSHASVLKNHLRTHTGQMLKCLLPGCHFETIRKENLLQHQLTHSKEKPHQCDVCGKAFSLVKNLRRHMKQHDFNALKHKCQVWKPITFENWIYVFQFILSRLMGVFSVH